MDRCALFVDAGYVLADGAMAVHGTRHRGSVSWDYAGLVKLLTGLSRDRTGLPVLRCYWYEATVEGRRSAEHETLGDLPGLKLRIGRIRPGRRDGVETEMHRDLAILARNHAISDAVIVSAEEDLAEIVAEVQDLGMRVVIVHITVDGSWTVSRPLRQESDDIVEVSRAHLRPFVDLIAGAEPAMSDEPYSNGSYQPRSLEAGGFEARDYQRRGLANGHGTGIGAVTHQGLPAAALPAPPTIYTAPVVEEYQRTAQPTDPGAMGPSSGSMGTGPMSTGPMSTGPMSTGHLGSDSMGPGPLPSSPPAAAPPAPAAAVPPAPAPAAPPVSPPPVGLSSPAGSSPPTGGPQYVAPSHQAGPPSPAGPSHQVDHGALPGEPIAPQGTHALPPGRPGEPPHADAARNAHRSQEAPGSGRPGLHASQPMAQPSMPQAHAPQPLPSPVPQSPGPGDLPYGHNQRGAETGRPGGPAAARFADVAAPAPPTPGRSGVVPPMPSQQMPGQPMPGQQMPGQQMPGQYPSAPPGQFGGNGPGQMPSHQQFQGSQPGQPPTSAPGSGYSAPQHDQGPYSGPQSAAHSPVSQPVPQPMTVSLADAVRAAHAEGFGFGDAVVRDAPALWLEAVLARKPRMPSDLEARLLQGSALPIDSLLHDEVRHSLRRGFWDALERSRR